MTARPEPAPIRRSELPSIPPPEWEFHTWFPRPDGGGDLVPGQLARGVHVRRRVTYGDWEPVRPDRWAAEPPSDVRAVSSARPTPATERDTLRGRIAAAVDRAFDAWRQGLGETRPQDAVTDAVLAVLPAPDQQTAIERAFVERLAAELKGCCTECDACIEIAQRMAGKAQDGAAKRAPMDPVHILGIDAPAAVARSGQPETDLVEHLARGLAGAAAVNRQRIAVPWDDLTAGQQDAYRQQARTILSPQTGQPDTD